MEKRRLQLDQKFTSLEKEKVALEDEKLKLEKGRDQLAKEKEKIDALENELIHKQNEFVHEETDLTVKRRKLEEKESVIQVFGFCIRMNEMGFRFERKKSLKLKNVHNISFELRKSKPKTFKRASKIMYFIISKVTSKDSFRRRKKLFIRT